MQRIIFSADDITAIAFDRYHHPEPFVQRKCEVLWLKHQGLTHDAIAPPGRGVPLLRAALPGRVPPRRPERHPPLPLERPARTPRQPPPRAGRLLPPTPAPLRPGSAQVIAQRTGIRRGQTQVRRFLHRLGLQPRRVAAVPLPPKATAEEHARMQRQFLDEELEPVLAEARAGRRDVYFVDGTHFVHAVFLGWVWCVVRWFIRSASGRKRYNVLGAVHAVNHQLIRVTNHSYLNAESVCALLRAVAVASVGRPITVVLDNARYQKGALVQDLAQCLGDHAAVPARILAQPESDRAGLEVRQEAELAGGISCDV